MYTYSANEDSCAIPNIYTKFIALAILAGLTNNAYAQAPSVPTEESTELAASESDDLGTVEVQGVDVQVTSFGSTVGMNGSSDAIASEGSGTYSTSGASIGSKSNVAMRDIPQSVSITTKQRMQDQRLNNLSDVLEQTTGISTLTGGDGTPTFFSRGFEINTFQLDGGAPVSYGASPASGGINANLRPSFDMSLYDRVEVLRGADGQYTGNGNPGGVVNLQRKRPTGSRQVALDASAGSFDTQRLSADISTPLFDNPLMRLRVVGTAENKGLYFAPAYNNKRIAYANLEFEPFEGTQINIGGSHTRERGLPWFFGFMRGVNGEDLKPDPFNCLCADWSRDATKTSEYFVQWRQEFTPDWRLSVNSTYITQQSESKVGYLMSMSGVAPDGSGVMYNGSAFEAANRTIALDATLNGAFDFMGLRQEVTFGANYSDVDSRSPNGGKDNVEYIFAQPVNYFDFDRSEFPSISEGIAIPASSKLISSKQKQYSVYGNLKITPWNPLHFIVGTSFNAIDSSNLSQSISGTTTSIYGFEFDDKKLLKPNISVIYDASENTTVYASRNSIYNSQATSLNKDLQSLPPVTGSTYELGVRQELLNDTLQASASLYYTEQYGMGVTDTSVPAGDPRTMSGNCCYVAGDGKNLSRGVDLELSGFITPEIQAQIGYTYNNNEQQPDSNSGEDSAPLQSKLPANILKLFASYQPSAGPLANMTIGGGMRAQSESYTTQTVGDSSTGEMKTFDIVQSPYAVFDIFARYNITENLEAQVNVKNLFDKRYYATISSPSGGNWYGDPRTIYVSIRSVF